MLYSSCQNQNSSCDTCPLQNGCATLQSFKMRRGNDADTQALHNTMKFELYSFFIRWLRVLFILYFAELIIGGISDIPQLETMLPGFSTLCDILISLAQIGNLVVYFILAKGNSVYHKVAFSNVLVLIAFFILGFFIEDNLTAIYIILALIIGLTIYIYYITLYAHAEIIRELSAPLADSWRGLFKWILIAPALFAFSAFLYPYIKPLGIILICIGCSSAAIPVFCYPRNLKRMISVFRQEAERF